MADLVKQAVQGSSNPAGTIDEENWSDFKIVPVKALPIVAAVIIGLIVSIAGNWHWALDFYHVVGGGLQDS